MLSEEQQALVDFSREAAEAIQMYMAIYPDMFEAVRVLSQAPPGPSTEAEMAALRLTAGQIGEALLVLSRTIDISMDTYHELRIEARHHPLLARGILQDMGESYILASRAMAPEDLQELPLALPEELQAKVARPQLAAWITMNARPDEQQEWRHELQRALADEPEEAYPEEVEPVAALPSAESSGVSVPYPPAEPSPYPSVEPSPYPSPEADLPVAPPPPPVPEEPNRDPQWQSPPPPQPLPDDRGRN